MYDFSNKVVLVTGANGGIGSAIVRDFSKYGASLILTGTNEEKLIQLSKEIPNSKYIICNLSEHEEVKTLVDRAVELFGKLDILICNAGKNADNLFIRMPLNAFEDVINVNLTSTFILNQAAAKHMMRNRYGKIINISSVVVKTGNPGQANYVASKAGIEGLTRVLANEVASRGINVNAIAPGFIMTQMTEALTDIQKEAILSKIPMASFGKPEDVANLALFLSSDVASYITGQVIGINGGMI